MGHDGDSAAHGHLRLDAPSDAPMRLAVIVCFQNEGEHLATLLASIDAQSEGPDQLVLVDDGSDDSSPQIVAAYRDAHPDTTTVLTRARRERVRDRLAEAPEWQAFEAGLATIAEPWEVVVKLDGDLRLPASLFADVRARLRADQRLGVTGAWFSERRESGRVERNCHPAAHVRGANKFYRRQCYEQIAPIPAQLGWDTFDELRARARGWRTETFEPAGGDVLHLRPTGSFDGLLRGYRRWGECAWAYGAHPLGVLAGALRRARQRPRILGGAFYLAGWVGAALRREPRLEAETRAVARREDLDRIRSGLARLLRVDPRRGAGA